MADAGEKHAEIVVNLGNRADGGSRIVAGRLLGNRNRGAESSDVVDIGLRHLPQELTGERRQAFDVTTLPLREQSVEGQRTLPRTAHARQTDELVAGDDQFDVAQVMLASALDDDVRCRHDDAW